MKRTYDNFEFISDTMNYSTIESEVSNYYNLGFPESSNFMPNKIGRYGDCTLLTTNGLINFSMTIGQSKEGKYIISVMPYNIKYLKWLN